MRDEVTMLTWPDGAAFTLLTPQPQAIRIETIAHALSQICRWGGHTRQFYSVAQHSVLVSKQCDPPDALWGLLHDAAEAYCGDIIRPLRASWEYAVPRAVEDRLQLAVCEAFSLPHTMPASVEAADHLLSLAEQRDLFMLPPGDRPSGEVDHVPRIHPWRSSFAEDYFLFRYASLRDSGGGCDARR